MGENLDRIKGFIGIAIMTPIAVHAIGGLSALGGGIGRASQSIVSAGYLGASAKMSGATNLFKK